MCAPLAHHGWFLPSALGCLFLAASQMLKLTEVMCATQVPDTWRRLCLCRETIAPSHQFLESKQGNNDRLSVHNER